MHWRLDGGAGAAPGRPWDQEEREASGRAGRRAAELVGGERYRRSLYLNGYRYSAEVPLPLTPAERERRVAAFEYPAEAVHAQGLTYWEAVLLPEIEEGDRKLASVEPDALSPTELSDHLAEAVRWYERLWMLHSPALRTIRAPRNNLKGRFTELYAQLTGEDGAEGVPPLLAYVPNKLSEAIDGLIELASIVQAHPALRRLFETEEAAAILDRLDGVEGGETFRARFERLLAEQALRSDAGAFTVGSGSQPGWAERPSLVLTLVQRYVPQDLDALARAHEAGVAARDALAAALRDALPEEATRRRFDALLDGARREARAYEDHNYYIDCAAGALLHRALTAAGRRLAGSGALESTDDVWWLRLHEIAGALRGLDGVGGVEGAGGAAMADGAPRWGLLVQSRKTLHEWQRSLTPPDWLGAPPPQAPLPAPAGPVPTPDVTAGTAGEHPPDSPNVLVTGQPGSRGVATGRVRLVPRDALVPDVAPGDVLVARNAGVLWTPVFPVAAAVVLDEGTLLQHAMSTCREYGVPGVFQAKRATAVLHEGQIVTVDGTSGRVLLAGEG
jgi:pyruvate,water dikinase